MTIHRWSQKLISPIAFILAIGIVSIGNVGRVDAEIVIDSLIEEGLDEQDPWEPFNDQVFSFNRQADRFLLKPIATGYDWVLPDPVQSSVGSALDNLDVVRRLTNNVLQLKFAGAGREMARFTINSTLGIAGLFDVAKGKFGIEQADEDTGQTLGFYGIEPGPYLILPFFTRDNGPRRDRFYCRHGYEPTQLLHPDRRHIGQIRHRHCQRAIRQSR